MRVMRILFSFLLVMAASSRVASSHHVISSGSSIYGPQTELITVSSFPRERSWRGRSPSQSRPVRLRPSGYLRGQGTSSVKSQRFGLKPMVFSTRQRDFVKKQMLAMSLKPRLIRKTFHRRNRNNFDFSKFTSSGDTVNSNSITSVLETPVVVTTGHNDLVSNSVLALLMNSRADSSRTRADELAISKHLIKLEEIQRNGDTIFGRALERQLRYIEAISDRDVRRETLKLFIKDIVEKSGFLSEAADHSNADTAKLMSLVDMIGDINDRFIQQATSRVDLIASSTPTTNILSALNTGESLSLTDQKASSQERISSALSAFQTNPGRKDMFSLQNDLSSSFKSRFRVNDRLSSYKGRIRSRPAAVKERDRIRLMVGKSIYGERPVPFLRTIIPTTRAPPTTRAVARKRETVGRIDVVKKLKNESWMV